MKYGEMLEEYVKNFANIGELKINKLSGTTVLSLKYKNGVVMAGDMRMCKGPMEISSENFEKIFQIKGGALVAVAGTTAIALQVIKSLNLEIEYFKKVEEAELSFEGKANLLSKILAKLFPLTKSGISVLPILACKDKIYAFDELGARWKVDYQAVGAGASFIVANLGEKWKTELTREESIKIAVNSLARAAKINPFTGPSIIVYTIEDNVFRLLDKDIKQIMGGNK